MNASLRHLALAGAVTVAAFAAAGCGGTSPLARSASATSVPNTVPSTAPPPAAPTSPTTQPPSTLPPQTSVPPTAPPSAASSAQARSLLKRALRDALAQRWAHVTGTGLATVAGPDRGTQTVTSNGQTGQILVLPGTTYVKADATALHSLFEVPAAIAPKVAGKWVALTKSDTEYASVTEGVTLPSELDALELVGSLRTEGFTASNGQHYTAIGGSLPGSSNITKGLGVVLVTKGSRPLPFELEGYSSAGVSELAEAFGQWGKAETVVAPAGAVPLPASSGSGAA